MDVLNFDHRDRFKEKDELLTLQFHIVDKDNLKDEKSDDFVENNEGQMSTFCEFHNLTSLSKEPEYFKNPNYPCRNNLKSTSLPHSF